MRDHIIFFINGKPHHVSGRAAFSTLANHLRYELGLTGTKIVCEEGDCGACSVLIGRVNGDQLEYQAVNSCIQALVQLDGTSIITVEGLQGEGGELTPVQQAMVRCHGSQCGYCTPGFVVALTALFEDSDRLEESDVRDGLTGNLCRCTGYEPIIRAALEVKGEQLQRARDFYPMGPLIHAIQSVRSEAVRINWEGRTFFAPTAIEEAVRFKQEHAPVTIVQGGTDVGVWVNKRGFAAPALMSLANVPGLDQISYEVGNLTVGANVTLAKLEAFIRDEFRVDGAGLGATHAPAAAALREFARILHVFGAPQIKNAATLAGNIANASPIADTLPFLFVMDANLELTGVSGVREVPINDFFKGYKQVDLAPDEIITRVVIPADDGRRTTDGEVLRLYKVSRRRDLDISAFAAAIRLQMSDGRIESARLAFGGVAPVVLRLKKTEEFLAGKRPSLELFEHAGRLARTEVAPISDVRGSKEFRFQLAANIFSKFWYEAFDANGLRLPLSESPEPDRPFATSMTGSVGKSIPHDSAPGHVTGRALFVDDIPFAGNELIVDFYWSRVSHGRIRSLDLSEARSVPGVVALFTHEDLTGRNRFGPIIQDELLLAEEVVTFIGQPIVVIAAENREAIRRAKEAIRIDIEQSEPVFTIDEARRRKLFIGVTRTIQRGDVGAAFASAEHVLEGCFVSGGADQFYLESQAAIAYPGESDSLTVHSATQNPSEVQDVVAHILGLPVNKVTVMTKRLGGGFGGKECQATHPAAMAALVAHRTKRPARIVYSKDDDMQVTGGRHPFQNDYRVAFTREGLITALKADLYSDGGAFADLSTAVMGRAMTHVDNAYFIPNAEIHGTICRTNYAPNTAMRGFGGPQGVATIENVMEEIALFLKKDPLEIRMKNCYGIENRNTTPYGQIVVNNTLPRLFTECAERADYTRRSAAVARFNADSKTHLKGLALTAVKFGISFNTKFLNQANALVNVYLDGSVQVSTGATEMGQGVNTKIRQLVAEEFAIDVDSVLVMITSTEKNNNTSATAASSGADLNGSAAVDACRKIRSRMIPVAAEELARRSGDIEPSPTTIVFQDGEVYDSRRPAARLTFKELVKLCYLRRLSLGERGFYATAGIDWDAEKGSGTPFLYFTQGCAVSEVLIDRFTGMMRVLRSDLLMDIGESINPGVDRGQITGAFIQGMGWLTNEELRYAADGTLLSHSPTTYKIPNIQDMPEIFNVDWILNDTNRVNIRSSKAVGEPPLLLAISVWCAVKNALSYVSGGEIPKLNVPATPEEILTRMTAYRNASRVVTRNGETAIATG